MEGRGAFLWQLKREFWDMGQKLGQGGARERHWERAKEWGRAMPHPLVGNIQETHIWSDMSNIAPQTNVGSHGILTT